MKNTKTWMSWLGAGAIVIAGVAGCGSESDQANPTQADANRAGAVGGVADNAGQAAENVGTAASNEVAGAGNAIANTGNVVGNMAGGAANTVGNGVAATSNAVGGLAAAATMTPKIKTALANNPALTIGSGAKINVDTLPDNKIALRGAVKSASQKTLAESIAKKNAPGYTIVNQLKVNGK